MRRSTCSLFSHLMTSALCGRGMMKILASSAVLGLLATVGRADWRGCPADYYPLGCFSDANRIMPMMVHHEVMSHQVCYFLCNDGLNTHFGTQNSNECWCSVEPDLNQIGLALGPGECNMPCAGTTDGDWCGGFHKMMVYEITAYQGCHPDALHEPELSWLRQSEDEQLFGQPWDYQEKFGTTFFTSSRDPSSSLPNDISARVFDVEDDHEKLLAHVHVWEDASKASPRVFCGIYTHRKNHYTKVKAIRDTWASHCDGFVAFSDATDLDLGTFMIKHEGPERYENLWQKSRAIWKYINFHYKSDFDWFVLGGDDLFLIVENLRKYLRSDVIARAAGGLSNGGTNPMYLGRRFRPSGIGPNRRIFNSGGPSYVLNQASLALLAAHLDDDTCQPHTENPEDVLVAWCLHRNGVEAFDTRDALGRERFHHFTPAVHFGYRIPEKPEDRLVAGHYVGDWYAAWTIDLKFGLECCSQDSISFHYVDEQLMRRLYHLIY